MPPNRSGPQQSTPGYRSHASTLLHSDTSSNQRSAPSRTQPLLQPSPVTSAPRGQYQSYEHPRHPSSSQIHQRPQQTLQRHQSQPQSTLGPSPPYPKQQQQQQQQYQHLPQTRQQNQHMLQPQYGPSYGDAGVSSSSHHASYTDSRAPLNHSRLGSNTLQSHHQSQPSRERDHHRSSSGHSSNSGSGSFTMEHYYSYSRNGGSYSTDSHRMVTHRPSLTAHQLSNPLTGYMHIPENTTKDEALILPSLDVIDHLVDMHFRFVHPVLPMLHYKTISDQIHRNESPPSHLLFAVLGLASRFSDNPTFRAPQPGLERPPCTIFYERAKYFIKDEYDNSQIATVQSLLLMAIQQMGFCESQRAWLYVGMAIRMAQDLGLNKESSDQEQARNRLQCELRKRTWWSVYVVERLVCAGLGKPLAITHKDSEASYPQYVDDEDEATAGRSLTVQSTCISNFVHLITLSKIQGNVLEYIKAKYGSPSKSDKGIRTPCIGSEQEQDCGVDTSAARFSCLDKSLTQWRQSLPESLQDPTAQSPHFGLFLHLTFNTVIILLHRPEVPNSATSASLCAQAAATISDITEILMDAKALTSMFISCLYAIFSAGIIHFMNIPSVKRSAASSSASPLTLVPSAPLPSHTMSAKTNLKRCIDALKFLASHWVSAARRAKILEDLLDLKHVSLKDLEVDTFKMSPVGPSWALESQYKEALVGPREGQDKLRQQCRSKVMAIHSLLANDDEFRKMQRRRSTTFGDQDGDDNMEADGEESSQTEESEMRSQVETPMSSANANESPNSISPTFTRPFIGLGVQSPFSSPPSASSPASVRTENSSVQQPSETDPSMMLATVNLGLSDSPAVVQDKAQADIKAEGSVESSGLLRHDNGLLVPVTMTTLAHGGTSPLLNTDCKLSVTNGKSAGTNNAPSKQGAMLDPFSMPSSIDWNRDRRPSDSGESGAGHQTGSQFNTVWTVDSLTNRTTARSAVSSAIAPSTDTKQDERMPDSDGRQIASATPNTSAIAAQAPSLYCESSTHAFPGSKLTDRDDQDLVWNDMPPTLGLDEWTAYIGAMMMRWLYASGQSSPRSTTSA
ncbi:fungal-specific transcription factor domain-containing protein [Gamsiella multidivaricata]|uniref:fungal-specific transcription factor domain-containing protein n=1 Tax=Gamsiella multidivaricata TaxID=101098 RepID=UPI00221ED104|nr:fungal-specific transcription factor domain-containing protein [Gamsiella multidivaricata]KAI7824606.1 fungal-specific transcription factor domain-containing protein [Gamsiella multidivaricata]